MEKRGLKELITEHKEKFLVRSDLMRRDIQDIVEKYLGQKEIVLITGIRRCGKSSLMRLICDDVVNRFRVPASNILYLNFEDERFVDFTVNDFELVYEAFLELEKPTGKKYFFLDEIQNLNGWEKWLNRLYEFEDIKIFVTGSNASLLSAELSTALTGRNRQIVVWPFSFKEFLKLDKFSVSEKDFYSRQKKIEIKEFLENYFKTGGFPEVLKIADTTLLEQYYKDIIYRDVIARYSIKNIKEIKELALFLCSNIGTIQSYESLRKVIKVKSVNTVKNYLEALENVFLFISIDLFDYSIKRQIYNPSKIYSIDVALSNSVSFKFSINIGHAYENLVLVELKRQNKEVFYWKSKKGLEVDFITRKGLKVDEAIQVSYSLSDRKTKEREIMALLNAKEEINPSKLYIISEETEGEETYNGVTVKFIPLWKWLLQD